VKDSYRSAQANPTSRKTIIQPAGCNETAARCLSFLFFAVGADLIPTVPESIQHAAGQLGAAADYKVTVAVRDSGGNPRYSTLLIYDQVSKVVRVATNTSLVPGELGTVDLTLPAGTYSVYARTFGLLPQEFENIGISADRQLDLTIEAGSREIPAYFTGSKYSPFVIRNDGVEAAQFELNVTNSDVESIQVFNEFARLMINGEVLGKFELYDNGTNGDRVAADGVFSRGLVSTTMNMRGASGRSDPASGEAYGSRAFTLYAKHVVSGQDSIVHLPDTALGVVNKNLEERTVIELSPELRLGDYFANLLVTDLNPDDIKDHVKKFYDYFPDHFGTHWGYCDVNGILGGFDPGSLVDHGNGSYTVSQLAPFGWSGDNRKYADLELYLAPGGIHSDRTVAFVLPRRPESCWGKHLYRRCHGNGHAGRFHQSIRRTCARCDERPEGFQGSSSGPVRGVPVGQW
jgi:hypothetical protein